jgi:hypothetical protein
MLYVARMKCSQVTFLAFLAFLALLAFGFMTHLRAFHSCNVQHSSPRSPPENRIESENMTSRVGYSVEWYEEKRRRMERRKGQPFMQSYPAIPLEMSYSHLYLYIRRADSRLDPKRTSTYCPSFGSHGYSLAGNVPSQRVSMAPKGRAVCTCPFGI